MELPTAAMLLKPGLEVDAFLDRFQIPDSTRNMHVRRMVSIFESLGEKYV